MRTSFLSKIPKFFDKKGVRLKSEFKLILLFQFRQSMEQSMEQLIKSINLIRGKKFHLHYFCYIHVKYRFLAIFLKKVLHNYYVRKNK